jgi:cystathionine beta-lyase
MAGVLALNSPSLIAKYYHIINSTGCGLAPTDCSLLLRGLKTLDLRMSRAQASAQIIAEYLHSHGFLVRYPGLKSHPQYEMHWSQATGAGAVLSFTTGDVEVSQKIVDACHLWAISVSFGSVNSLISMPCKMSHASISEETRRARGLAEDVIRLCVGIEDVEDLKEDLEQALVLAGAVKKEGGKVEEAVEGKQPIEREDPEGVSK